jgi:PhzF family phenazine biosynthesis protein
MHQVDAFADEPVSGNPAAVFILEHWLTDQTMQMIAEENNLSETAFARLNGAGWDLRWFSPRQEVNFCGHATLATAHVLVNEFAQTGQLMFKTRIGQLTVVHRENNLTLEVPRPEPEPAGELTRRLAETIGNGILACFRNWENVFAELSNERAVRGFLPDLLKIAQLHPFGLAITAVGHSHDFVSRYFAPGAGIPEDPVTGSTHATLVPYWAQKSAFQCSRRGGNINCELGEDRVMLTGKACTFMKAEVYIPD